MLMKVFNKGQVVIPAAIRRKFGIGVGDYLEVTLDPDRESIRLTKPETTHSDALAGSLARYGRKRTFPTKAEMRKALEKGLGSEEKAR
jgi:AbrB family looped-hinge helix DNA binding protein